MVSSNNCTPVLSKVLQRGTKRVWCLHLQRTFYNYYWLSSLEPLVSEPSYKTWVKFRVFFLEPWFKTHLPQCIWILIWPSSVWDPRIICKGENTTLFQITVAWLLRLICIMVWEWNICCRVPWKALRILNNFRNLTLSSKIRLKKKITKSKTYD